MQIIIRVQCAMCTVDGFFSAHFESYSFAKVVTKSSCKPGKILPTIFCTSHFENVSKYAFY